MSQPIWVHVASAIDDLCLDGDEKREGNTIRFSSRLDISVYPTEEMAEGVRKATRGIVFKTTTDKLRGILGHGKDERNDYCHWVNHDTETVVEHEHDEDDDCNYVSIHLKGITEYPDRWQFNEETNAWVEIFCAESGLEPNV